MRYRYYFVKDNYDMETGAVTNKAFKEYVGLHFLLAFLYSILLFYIHEGAYSFEWLNHWGNWVVYGIYLLGMFSGQILAQYFIFRNFVPWLRVLLSVIVGGTIGLFAVIGFFAFIS